MPDKLVSKSTQEESWNQISSDMLRTGWYFKDFELIDTRNPGM